MTLFWIGAGLLVLGAVGFLVAFVSGDYNTGRSPRWAKVVGIAGVVAMIAGAVTIAASVYYGIAGWLT